DKCEQSYLYLSLILPQQLFCQPSNALAQLRWAIDRRIGAEAGEIPREPVELAWRAAKRQATGAVGQAHDVLAKLRLALDIRHAAGGQAYQQLGVRLMAIWPGGFGRRGRKLGGGRRQRTNPIDPVDPLLLLF